MTKEKREKIVHRTSVVICSVKTPQSVRNVLEEMQNDFLRPSSIALVIGLIPIEVWRLIFQHLEFYSKFRLYFKEIS